MSELSEVVLKLTSSVATLTAQMANFQEYTEKFEHKLTTKIEELETMLSNRPTSKVVENIDKRLEMLEEIQLKKNAIYENRMSIVDFARKNWFLIAAIVGWIGTAGYTIDIAKQAPSVKQEKQIKYLENRVDDLMKRATDTRVIDRRI